MEGRKTDPGAVGVCHRIPCLVCVVFMFSVERGWGGRHIVKERQISDAKAKESMARKT